MHIYCLLIVALMILLSGCEKKDVYQKEYQIPDSIKKLENLSFYPTDAVALDTIFLKKETVFESDFEDVIFDGYITNAAIDDENRVYLVVSNRMASAIYIHVFQPNGTYIEKVGRYGRGPGEFQNIISMDIWNNNLYVLDDILQRISVFSLDDFTLIEEIAIRRNKTEEQVLPMIKAGRQIFVRNDSTYLVGFRGSIFSNDSRSMDYFEISANEDVAPKKVVELKRYKNYRDKIVRLENVALTPFVMPFTRHSLITLSSKGTFYTAWTEDFFKKNITIKVIIRRLFTTQWKKANWSCQILK